MCLNNYSPVSSLDFGRLHYNFIDRISCSGQLVEYNPFLLHQKIPYSRNHNALTSSFSWDLIETADEMWTFKHDQCSAKLHLPQEKRKHSEFLRSSIQCTSISKASLWQNWLPIDQIAENRIHKFWKNWVYLCKRINL